MKQLLILFLSFCFSLGLKAQENNDSLFNKGINAFNDKDYVASAQVFEAVSKYEKVIGSIV